MVHHVLQREICRLHTFSVRRAVRRRHDATWTALFSQCRAHHVAVVGSGPAGFYTSKYMMRHSSQPHVDMFERLPTPFGLVRFGVAPDHPEVKNVTNDFTDVAASPRFRFFGNVEIGRDLTLSDLQKSYDAVVICVGAQGERLMDIPGEGLRGVAGGPEFVKWYNSHPDHVGLELPGPGDTAVVVGQGNVALDIARVLARAPSDLSGTDINPRALRQIGIWQQRGLHTVHVVGRRGFVQAAFTNKELRELTTLTDVLPVVDPVELELCRNAASLQELAKDRAKKRSVPILDKMAENFALRASTSKRVIWLRFLLSPSEILDTGAGSVAGMRFDRNELKGEVGRQVASRLAPTVSETLPCGLIVRSVGFQLTQLDGLPLNGQGRVNHRAGLVEQPGISPSSAALFVSGWHKNGPTGVIATNIPDSQETAASVLGDLSRRQSHACPETVEQTLKQRGINVVTFQDWKAVEAEELRRGAEDQKVALRLTDASEMLRLVENARKAAGV
mmetsp:Transcript_31481/g.83937  ORF Transcript_31481/g.83937 Transcript_31481/m.83937 type:complete len:504 (-) Transcript_31481:322-1833(-)